MLKVTKIRLAALSAAAVAGVSAAVAAVPADVTTAITTAKTDSETMGAAILVVIVGIFALKLLRKAL